MEYNTTRAKLTLPEYGRNVQSMVEYALTLTDRDERQQCAETIIKVMGSRFPLQKNTEEFEHMLWDHLALISGYKLDVDSPYPINVHLGMEAEHPQLDYPNHEITFRHYGRTLEQMTKALAEIPEGEERQEATELVVAQMAKNLSTWNRNVLTPEKLAIDLELLTGGKVTLTITPQRMEAIIRAASAQSKNNNGKKKKK